ncbi:LuxE/PaaK family acyltransferase [Mycobacterium montefiorense]|uniref:LuxE/PaaK family acyltransferase n=1 Tax=Mycobacterium montefiorense TaxID=154654 RepID=UPI0021F282D8|nr:hypothetical protein [Mycobacterium montefiorense]MCV7429334.1 hypothetical protein [Mycobacterium montefiorense]
MDLNTMLGMPGEALRTTRTEWRQSLTNAVQAAFVFHYERNDLYRAQCDAVRVCPHDIIGYNDLHRIPLLPAVVFKQGAGQQILTAKAADIEIEVRSAGSSGVPSVSRRDAMTVTRASVGTLGCFRDFFELSNGTGLFLYSSKSDDAGFRMPKVFDLLTCTLDDYSYATHNRPFDIGEALTQLRSWEGAKARHIIGTPLAITRLIKVLELESIRMNLGLTVTNYHVWRTAPIHSVSRHPRRVRRRGPANPRSRALWNP